MEKIRQAKESDKRAIVDCIINAFQKDFSGFINQVGREKVQSFLEGRVMYNAKKQLKNILVF